MEMWQAEGVRRLTQAGRALSLGALLASAWWGSLELGGIDPELTRLFAAVAA